MPRTKSPPTTAEYAVLGILNEAPAHGYRIAQRFVAGQDLGLLYSIEQSAVYALLHDLAARQLIHGRRELSGRRPPRTLFSLTEAGRVRLRAWLSTPAEPLRRLSRDFLLKLHFLDRDDPGRAQALIVEQLAVLERYLAELDEELRQVEAGSLDELVFESKRVTVAGFASWLSRKRRMPTAVG